MQAVDGASLTGCCRNPARTLSHHVDYVAPGRCMHHPGGTAAGGRRHSSGDTIAAAASRCLRLQEGQCSRGTTPMRVQPSRLLVSPRGTRPVACPRAGGGGMRTRSRSSRPGAGCAHAPSERWQTGQWGLANAHEFCCAAPPRGRAVCIASLQVLGLCASARRARTARTARAIIESALGRLAARRGGCFVGGSCPQSNAACSDSLVKCGARLAHPVPPRLANWADVGTRPPVRAPAPAGRPPPAVPLLPDDALLVLPSTGVERRLQC